MNEDLQFVIDTAEEAMSGSVSHLEAELVKVRAGRASAGMLDGIFVDFYGARTALAQMSNISTPDARTITLQPWDKSMLDPVLRAIQAANLGFNPTNNGTILICSIPPLTEERRKDMVKRCRTIGEDAKVSVRTARRDANEEVKKLTKAGLPEDEGKGAETKIQELTDKYSAMIDKHLEAKEKEILTV